MLDYQPGGNQVHNYMYLKKMYLELFFKLYFGNEFYISLRPMQWIYFGKKAP